MKRGGRAAPFPDSDLVRYSPAPVSPVMLHTADSPSALETTLTVISACCSAIWVWVDREGDLIHVIVLVEPAGLEEYSPLLPPQ